MEHVAIDLGRPNSVMCELGDGGKKVLRGFRLNRANLDRFFSGRRACRVLIESSTESEWVARHIEGLGHEVVVADPNYAAMYGERNRRVKTDRRDADALFEANRLGIFRRAHRRSEAQRQVIAMQGVRGALVRTRTRWINVVRALLRREGLQLPSGAAESFVERVEALNLPPELQELMAPLLTVMGPLNEKIKQLDRKTEALGKEDARVRLLQTAPMIGAQTATGFVALIDDVSRFSKAHKLENYLGLVPSEWLKRAQNQGRYHQTWRLACALAARRSRLGDSEPSACRHHRTAQLGARDRPPAWNEGRRRRAGSPARRHPLRHAA